MSQSVRLKPLSKRKLLVFSIFISLILHGLEIHFLQRQAFWFSSPQAPLNSVDSWTLAMSKKEKNQILKETFHVLSYSRKGTHFGKLSPIHSTPQIALSSPHPESFSNTFLDGEIFFPKMHLLSFVKNPSHSIPFEDPVLPPLPKIELSSRAFEETIPTPPPEPLAKTLALLENLPRQPISDTSPSLPLKGISFSSELGSLKFTPPTLSSVTPLLKIPSLLERRTPSYSSFFDTEIVFLEEEEGSYLFAITLIPKENLKLDPLKQSYVFLIDRANSIQKERLNATKGAVKKAIEELHVQDQFNIVVFDQKVEKLSPVPLSVSPESIDKASGFLNTIELGNFFSQKNLYNPLFITVPHSLSSNELYTAILITDGDNLSSKSQLQRLTHDWTRLNQGKVSLYTLGINEDAHLDALDRLTNLNRGKTVSSPTHKGMKRKLLKLMKSIGSPLAKNITCLAIPRNVDSGARIELFPKGKNAPHLFLNEPYVILGKTDSLDDFVLFVQGNLANEWLHIKKTISFAEAKKAPPALASQFAQTKAVALYQKYLEGAGPEFLVEAREVSRSYDCSGVFD